MDLLAIFFIILRLLSVFLVQTSFVPDEYWQSLEVGHKLAFGYGYLTWEWQKGIRSYLLPGLIAVLYKGLHFLHLDSTTMLVTVPRLMVALLTAAGDTSLARLSGHLWGAPAARDTAFCLATSWCLFYCGSRTLANTIETALLALALGCYPWQPKTGRERYTYLYLGAVAAALRPTAALIWLPLWLAHLHRSNGRSTLVAVSATAGVAALLVSLAVDSACHGRPLLSALQFLRWNVLAGVASHYGTSAWHVHLTQSLPLLLTAHLPAALLGARRGRTAGVERLCAAGVLWLLAAYSVLPHKEFRFLLPIWPFCALLMGRSLSSLRRRRARTLLKAAILLINVPLALYLSLVHQRGPLDVTACLRRRLQVAPQAAGAHVLYLTPCHSTPLYSHLHVNVSTRFLTCEPNFSAALNYSDEADQFYRHPAAWLRRQYPALRAHSTHSGRSGAAALSWGDDSVGGGGGPDAARVGNDRTTRGLPSHVVMFDGLWTELGTVLSGFSVCEDVFHAHFHEPRRGRRLLVLCRYDWIT